MRKKDRINIAILASGNGSNAENMVRYFEDHNRIDVSLIITNNPSAFVISRAERLNIPCKVIRKKDWQNEALVKPVLEQYHVRFIVLSGYLLLLPSWLVAMYPERIINIHPALLPKFGGKGMYGLSVHEAVLNAQEKKSGITIHFVNNEYDKGDIIFQKECEVLKSDTPETLQNRIHQLEYEYFPKITEKIILQKFP